MKPEFLKAKFNPYYEILENHRYLVFTQGRHLIVSITKGSYLYIPIDYKDMYFYDNPISQG